MSCALGFDVGTRLIGVAVGNTLTMSARPLDTIAVHGKQPDWPRLAHLIEQWHPDALVVGLPLTRDGSQQAMTRHARRFADELRQRYTLPVHMMDERHSSQEAARRFASARAAGTQRRRDAQKIDAVAATVILEAWLHTQGGQCPPRARV